MFMQGDEAGNDGLAAEIEDLGSGGDVEMRADGFDEAAGDEEGLVFGGRGFRAVDDADVGKGDERRVDLDERLDGWGKRLRWKQAGGEEKKKVFQKWWAL